MSSTFSSIKKNVIIIAGPTASGKSDLAFRLAQHFQSEIFSADSRQLYTEMNIGTAKPGSDMLREVRHHFIGNISIHDNYSVGRYVEEIKHELTDYFKEKDTAIIVGGTGLYINALIHGLDDLPPSRPEVMADIKDHFEKFGIDYLVSWLKKLDPAYHEQVDKQNPHRIIRALAVSISENKPFSSFLGKKKTALPYEIHGIVLLPDRKVLYRQIENRVDLMMREGLEDEARALYSHKNNQALQTVGYQELFKYFEGEITLETAIEEIKKNSRRYAKRQITWLKKYGVGQIFEEADYVGVFDYLSQVLPQKSKDY